MSSLTQLEIYSDELATAVKRLANLRKSNTGNDLSNQPLDIDCHCADTELDGVRASILATITKIQAILCGPVDLLQQMVGQVCPAYSQHAQANARRKPCEDS